MADRTSPRKAVAGKAAAARVAAAGGPVEPPFGGDQGEISPSPAPQAPNPQPPLQVQRLDGTIHKAWEEPHLQPPQRSIRVAAIGAVGSPAQPPPLLSEIGGPTTGHAATEIYTIVSENLRSPQSAGVETTVVRAAPELSAPVGTPDGAISIPGEGILTADADRVPARTRKRIIGTRPARRVTKARLLHQADVAEAALKKLEPPYGGIGHNRPPTANRGAPLTPTQYVHALAAIGRLKDALATGGRAAIAAMKAAARTLARTTTILGHWLKPRVDKAADEFAKSFGKTAGPLVSMAAAAIVGYASGADKQLTILIKMIGQFFGTH